MLTTEEAAALLAERGIAVRQRGEELPPTARTVEAWCRSGALKARRIGGPRRGFWLIDRVDLDTFIPPKMGRGKPKTLLEALNDAGLLDE